MKSKPDFLLACCPGALRCKHIIYCLNLASFNDKLSCNSQLMRNGLQFNYWDEFRSGHSRFCDYPQEDPIPDRVLVSHWVSVHSFLSSQTKPSLSRCFFRTAPMLFRFSRWMMCRDTKSAL